ncbi:MAG: DNA-formamidopyrimidine glycosylase [Chloroflexota bacterium]|nr:DNA-formamidopyrimidine glycosylase [Chloroflexota bacterium]
MPELPDLEAIKSVLNSKIAGVKIERVEVMQPLVIRQPIPEEFISILTGNAITQVERRGKYLLFTLESKHVMAIHLMLTGKLQYCMVKENRKPRTCFIIHFEDGKQLRYFDSKLMGKIYLVEKGHLSLIPLWKEMGPDALDSELTLEVFKDQIRRHSGQIKNILLNSAFITGIGNAYADEILFKAGVYPFWPRSSLSEEEIEAIYHAMRSVIEEAVKTVSQRMGDDISMEIRDFLEVHRKGGKPCPVCGSQISQVQANRRITSFCRNCQKG